MLYRDERLSAIETALRHVLNSLRPRLCYELSQVDRTRLYNLLKTVTVDDTDRWDPDLAVSILRGVRYIGDRAIAPYMEYLTTVKSYSAGAAKVRETARKSLLVLQGRLEHEAQKGSSPKAGRAT
jgi:hypothetical protein